MTPVTAAKVKYGVWGLIGGAIIAMIIGFVWGGWTTHTHDHKAGRRGGLGGAGGDLRRAIHATTEPPRETPRIRESLFLRSHEHHYKRRLGQNARGRTGELCCRTRMRRRT